MQRQPTAPLPQITPDPLEEARRILRAAARLPYSAAAPNAWVRRFRNHLADARRALAAHVTRGERGMPAAAAAEQFSAKRQAAEHTELIRRAFGLMMVAEQLNAPDIWRMVNLSEETMALAQMVESHRMRLLEQTEGVAPPDPERVGIDA